MIKVDKLIPGDIYNKIMKILNVTNSETFDISLFAKSISKYITKLEDGSFEVRIPIKESLQNKNLIVYYVDDEGKKEEYEVTIENGYAKFNTNHFSIYTLAEKPITKNEEIKNPETSDKIIYDFIIGATSILGIALTIKLLKK